MVVSKRRRKVTTKPKRTSAAKKSSWKKELVDPDLTTHVFPTDVLDHAETELRAYCHIVPVLKFLSQQFALKPKDLKIWDPYFCKGTVVKHLAEIGFHNVRNVNEDFYKVQKTGVPDYHVLLTNPPYSSDHLERCLEFCKGQARPCVLLLPCWVAKKTYFAKLFGDQTNFLFIAPLDRYRYTMPPDLVPESSKPSWVGEDGQTSPFLSCWFVYFPPPFNASTAFETLNGRMAKSGPFDCVLAKRLQGVKWKLKKASGKPEASRKGQDTKRKRKNPVRLPRAVRAVPGTVEFD